MIPIIDLLCAVLPIVLYILVLFWDRSRYEKYLFKSLKKNPNKKSKEKIIFKSDKEYPLNVE